tara:strand:- start:223 stop:474 length:252 start_codon:yes stop_codon:yes gene_type:complete
VHFFACVIQNNLRIVITSKHKTERENKMKKVQIENLDNFLDVNDWHIFLDGPRKKGYFIYATKEDYRDKVKPAGVEVLMIELV